MCAFAKQFYYDPDDNIRLYLDTPMPKSDFENEYGIIINRITKENYKQLCIKNVIYEAYGGYILSVELKPIEIIYEPFDDSQKEFIEIYKANHNKINDNSNIEIDIT